MSGVRPIGWYATSKRINRTFVVSSFCTITLASRRNGIGRYVYQPSRAMPTMTDLNRCSSKPVPKKSPIGHSMLGWASPSQKILRMTPRHFSGVTSPILTTIESIIAGPWSVPMTSCSPAPTRRPQLARNCPGTGPLGSVPGLFMISAARV